MSERDEFRLDGKVALVTGAARGIGLECAQVLAAAGCSVMITDILDQEGETAAGDLGAGGSLARYHLMGAAAEDDGKPGAAYCRLDVTREDDWQAAISATVGKFGGLDILVNNAGIEIVAEIAETSQADFRRLMAVNVEGVFLGCKHAVTAMRPDGVAGRGGSIVNMSSIAGMRGVTWLSAYGATKGAVRLMTKDIAIECSQLGYGIRCNSVHPGVVRTEMADAFFEQHKSLGLADTVEGVEAAFLAAHPIGRLGTPRDVANAVRFLASDASAWITGTELSVDGGWSAR